MLYIFLLIISKSVKKYYKRTCLSVCLFHVPIKSFYDTINSNDFPGKDGYTHEKR